MEMTVGYVRIVQKRDKAVLLDLGETSPVWFPLYRITLDESAYTITAPSDLLQDKMAEAQGNTKKPTANNDILQARYRLGSR